MSDTKRQKAKVAYFGRDATTSNTSNPTPPIDTLRRSVDGIDLPPLPEPCGYLDAGKDAIGRDLSDAAWTEGAVTAYATAAVAAERERCARIADSYHVGEPPEEPTAAWIAAAIRGEQK
jgi:hypothetical protein